MGQLKISNFNYLGLAFEYQERKVYGSLPPAKRFGGGCDATEQ